jgi:hypothetical protein
MLSWRQGAITAASIKYAGLHGKKVRVIGKNRSTLGEDGTIQGAQSSDSWVSILVGSEV